MAKDVHQPFRFRHLYLDTNIVLPGWARVSAKLENVLSLAQEVGVSVYLPEAVERELESHWLRKYDEKMAKLQEALEPLKTHLIRLASGQVPPVNLPDRRQVETSYRESVKDIKQKWGIPTVPIPELGTAKLLDMAIGRQVAFQDKGANFQDTVIFLSVLGQSSYQTRLHTAVTFLATERG
jgi:PIN domain-containing protein